MISLIDKYKNAKPCPIALFLYNRPQHTERTLQFLQQNELTTQSNLYIFSDGAKTGLDKKIVTAIRKIIKKNR
ncbi:hypothetical protein ACUN24_03220 [Pedobacter sp. WC2501]|uniref:hypothetical protein n=1 Tax=Pedobacter sp. WC2501 TaxID=3461400 RepID=UPI0040461DD4